MDRLIAPYTVSAAAADVAPATGTPGFATNGNPATNTPATQWPAYQFNSIQEELIAIITAGQVTPDRTKNNQVLAAIMALIKGTTLPAMTFAQVAALTSDQGPVMVTDMGPSNLYVWSASAFFNGYRSVHCGEIPRNFSPSPRPWELSVTGGVWSTSDPKQARVIALFQEYGLTVPSANWIPGQGMISDLGGGNWKACDLQNMFLRMAGVDADTANPRLAGTYQQSTRLGTFMDTNAGSSRILPASGAENYMTGAAVPNYYPATSGNSTRDSYSIRPDNAAVSALILI